jgi:hypothetical protein
MKGCTAAASAPAVRSRHTDTGYANCTCKTFSPPPIHHSHPHAEPRPPIPTTWDLPSVPLSPIHLDLGPPTGEVTGAGAAPPPAPMCPPLLQDLDLGVGLEALNIDDLVMSLIDTMPPSPPSSPVAGEHGWLWKVWVCFLQILGVSCTPCVTVC